MGRAIYLRLKRLIQNLCLFFLSLLFTFLLLEVFLRLFPVAEPLSRLPVNATSPISKFRPNRDIIRSLGWNFYKVSKKHINNDGFFNFLDYFPNHTKPVVAIIGDSFVEAAQVNDNETFYYYLYRRYPQVLFYTFASRGSQLPTYLMYAKYAVEKYHPVGLIFVIIENDFDESFYECKHKPGFSYFKKSTPSIYTVSYKPSKFRRLLPKFFIVRYLCFNLRVQQTLYKLGIKHFRIKNTQRIEDGKKL